MIRRSSGGANWRSYSGEPIVLIETHRMEDSEMTTNVLVAFYSTYGHVHQMAVAVAEGRVPRIRKAHGR